jgi:hypothetical protein
MKACMLHVASCSGGISMCTSRDHDTSWNNNGMHRSPRISIRVGTHLPGQQFMFIFITMTACDGCACLQDKRKEAQRIALAAASRVANASRVTEILAGGIRRVLPVGGPQRDQGESQAALIMAAQTAASKIAGNMGWRPDSSAASRLQALQSQIARASSVVAGAAPTEYFEADLIINDFPQAARYHVTHRDSIAQITERTGAASPVAPEFVMTSTRCLLPMLPHLLAASFARRSSAHLHASILAGLHQRLRSFAPAHCLLLYQ